MRQILKLDNPGIYVVMMHGRNIGDDGNGAVRLKLSGAAAQWEPLASTITSNGSGFSISSIVRIDKDSFGANTGNQLKIVRDCNTGTLTTAATSQSEAIFGLTIFRIS